MVNSPFFISCKLRVTVKTFEWLDFRKLAGELHGLDHNIKVYKRTLNSHIWKSRMIHTYLLLKVTRINVRLNSGIL